MSEKKIYIVGTPIGNLEDMTFRAVRILKEVDLIAAEDTRHTQKLLNYYHIKTPVTSYYEFNEREKAVFLVTEVKKGRSIAVVSNGGMPGISDPGYRIVREAIKHDIPLEAIPGPTSVVTGLVLSGLPTDRFVFEGFLEPKGISRKKKLFKLLTENRTIVIYESPRRISRFLNDVADILGNRDVVVIKELTKLHEKIIRGPVLKVLERFQTEELKGEYIVILSGKTKKDYYKTMPADKLIRYIIKKMKISRMEAIKLAAYILGITKSVLYKQNLNNK